MKGPMSSADRRPEGGSTAKLPPSSRRSSTSSETASGTQSALFKAARQGRLDAVERMVKTNPGVAVSARDDSGRTALHWAARKNRPGVASLLLANGADPDARDSEQMTPLHLAAVSGLLQDHPRGAAPVSDSANSSFFGDRDSYGQSRQVSSPPTRVNSQSRSHSRLCEDVSVPGQVQGYPSQLSFSIKQLSPLTTSRSLTKRSCSGAVDPQIALIEALDALEEPSVAGTAQRSAGKLRPFQDRWSSANTPRRLMASSSPRVNGWVADGVSPVLSRQNSVLFSPKPPSSPHGSLSTLEILLRFGAQLNAVDRHGRTPLHWAAWKGRDDSVAILLRHSADHTVADNDGRLAIHLASISGSLMVSS